MKKYYRGTLTSDDIQCVSALKTVLISNQGTYTTCFSCYGSVRGFHMKDVLEGSQIRKARQKVQECTWPCLLPCFCDN